MRRLLVTGVLAAGLVAGVLALPARPAAAIVDGEEADPGEWPWQVAIERSGRFTCGGSLLAMDIVLTAAHCVEDVDAEDLLVRAGIVDVDDAGQELDVATMQLHENYDDDDNANDIAVLRLDGAFEPGDDVEAVALPDADTAAELTVPGSTVFVTGFGMTSENGNLADHLLEGEVEIFDDDVCQDNYEDEGDDVDPEVQVCAGLEAGGTDACFGDSGGPLVVPADDRRSGWYLLGIVSFGEGCGRPGLPTVYTEVAAFADFLADSGALEPVGERFSSEEELRVPALGTRGKATRFPDTITVSDAPDDVAGVAVELHGLTHERPTDLDVWLEAPDGTVLALLSDVGGDDPVAGLDIVIEDGGASAGDRPLPRRVAPSDRQPGDELNGSRPVTDLGAFDDGGDVDGEWQLLIVDDRAGASGSIDGWSLVLR